MANTTYHCVRCNKTMDEDNFFTYKSGKKTEMCKKCLTAHVDNFDPETFLWLLEKLDVPYIEEEWNILRDRAFDRAKGKPLTGLSVMGRYLSKMWLKNFQNLRWSDTERLKEEKEAARRTAEEQAQVEDEKLKELFDQGLISEAEYRTRTSTAYQNEHDAPYVPPQVTVVGQSNLYQEDKFLPEEELEDFDKLLTKEDKIKMANKWGRLYTAAEWVAMETKYKEMMESFDIQDSDTDGTLILICKTFLKMNQAIDCGDLDGFQRLSRSYDALRKSAKFTAAQNKEQRANFIDSLGEMVAYCEQHGGQIPRFDITEDFDIYDKIIRDQKSYTRELVYGDASLSRMIEDYLEKRKQADANKKDKEQAREDGHFEVQLTDKDYEDYLSHQAELAAQEEE